VFENGVSTLDDGKEKPKKEPTAEEKEAAKCPKCKSLWPSQTDTCPCCGHVRQRRNLVEHVAGKMEEFETADKMKKQSWYSQLLYVAQTKGYSDGWIGHKMKEKFGVWPPMLEKIPMEPSKEVKSWIVSRNIAFAKGKAAHAVR
jgi:hypothetical protein